MFNYGVFVEYLTKFRINFVSKSNIGVSWGLLNEKICVSKQSFFGHVEDTFGNPGEKYTSSFRHSFSKTPKTKIDWSTLFWKLNMLILIKILWTYRINLWKPCRKFYSASWNFVRQKPKLKDGNVFSFKEKNFSYDVALDKYKSM